MTPVTPCDDFLKIIAKTFVNRNEDVVPLQRQKEQTHHHPLHDKGGERPPGSGDDLMTERSNTSAKRQTIVSATTNYAWSGDKL